ncbi:MAG: hydroxymethylglutaryl-CoA reductase, degradative [Archangiaceae bacterium]|nr:hydroxymethylglutaryl-CoA reductase, degradative [Archangiaceae bacterium]
MTVNSRLSGFYNLPLTERRRVLAAQCGLTDGDLQALSAGLATDDADQMIENAIGVFGLPLGVGLNFRINGRDRLIPMAVEEPSVVAAVSLAAKIVREAGGFTADADESVMISQVQVTQLPHEAVADAVAALELSAPEILASANRSQPQLVARGGGARELEVRVLSSDTERGAMVVVHLLVDVLDAMGANMVNTMAESVAPLIELLTGGKVYLRILSNLSDQRCARAACAIPLELLADFGCSGAQIAEGIVQAARFAELDPHRAATHNKGIMNGVDAVALATGNDWRALEAGAHAFAAMRAGYRPLSTWWQEKGRLHGAIELPLAVGTVGGAVRKHPVARLALKLLGNPSARDLAQVMAAVGLAQNLAALRALGSVGIQRGHMALHTRGRPPSLVATPEAGLQVVSAGEAAALPKSHGRFRFRVPEHWRSATGVNPHAREAEQQIIAWFERLGCSEREVARARKFDAAGYVGVPFPNLSPQTTVRIGKYLSMWLLWDDVHVETGENRWRLSAAAVQARQAPPDLTRFDRGWWELYLELASRRSFHWLDDICSGMVRWDAWARREAEAMAAVRAGARPPRFDVQLEMRIETIGMYPTAYLLEDAYDFELPRRFHADPRIRRLKKLANKIVGLGNDILSFAKDLAEGQLNLISTFMSETHCSADSALEQILAMHDEALAEYDRVAAEVGSWGPDCDPYVARWVQDIRLASLGFSLWESQAPRYLAHRIVLAGQVVEPRFEFFRPEAPGQAELHTTG